jgi:hypothetical protein
VDAPVGARVSDIPAAAQLQVINGESYYEYDGTFYKEVYTSKGKRMYEVVDKNALQNTTVAPATANTAPAVTSKSSGTEAIGMETSTLPANSTVIVINQQKYYQSPSGYYYQEFIKDNTLYYKIVGKVSGNP